MSLKLEFAVHRVSPVTVSKVATVEGVEVNAEVKGLEVELVLVDHGTSTQLRFTKPSEIAEAKEYFVAGESVFWEV